MAEFGGTHAMSAGLGAGLAASLGNHSKVVSRSYQSVVKAQQGALAQTKAIEQYMKFGCQLEAQKKWADAERSFKYVLQVVSRRDGPGSVKSVPALEHLVSVTKAQNKLDDAINFQETVLAFKKAESTPNPNEVVKAQSSLSNLLEQNNDYRDAASVLRQSVSYYNSHPFLPAKDKRATRSSYAKVLRKLHKDEEAELIEAANADEQKLDDNEHNIKPTIEKPPPPAEVAPTPAEQPKTEQ
jgi:hypothetical protein